MSKFKITLCALAASLGLTGKSHAADWWVAQTTERFLQLVDLTSIQPINSEKDDAVQFWASTQANATFPSGCYYSMSLLQVRCRNKQLRIIKNYHYDNSGQIISVENDNIINEFDGDFKWMEAIPDTAMDKMGELACIAGAAKRQGQPANIPERYWEVKDIQKAREGYFTFKFSKRSDTTTPAPYP